MEEVTRPGRPNLSARQLEIFYAVMETGSVTAASAALGVSQPSLSRSLQRLEDQLRIELFRRHRHRLVPTLEAQRVYEVVAPVIHQFRSISDAVLDIADGQTNVFRFAATQSVARVMVPRALRAMRQTTPGLRVFLDTVTRNRHLDYLVTAQGECILSLAEVDHPLVASADIARAPLCALLRSDHPLAGAASLSADDLREQTVLLFEHSGPHSAAIDNFFGGCRYMAGATYIRFSDAAVGLAAEGLGIALVDGFTAMDWLPPGLVRLPLVNAPEFQARLYWNRERPGSKFVDLLHKTLTTLTTET